MVVEQKLAGRRNHAEALLLAKQKVTSVERQYF